MFFENPYPDFCDYIEEEISLSFDGLHPDETAIANTISSPKRRAHFVSGRRCAHQAMACSFSDHFPVLKNEDRSPSWPKTVKGTITHDSDIAAALVLKPNTNFKGIGMDIEDLKRKLNVGVIRHILTPQEQKKWNSNPKQLSVETRIIFSIKEAIFKCFYPLNKIYLGFHDAEVSDLQNNTFEGKVFKHSTEISSVRPLLVEGKFFVHNNKVMAAVLF